MGRQEGHCVASVWHVCRGQPLGRCHHGRVQVKRCAHPIERGERVEGRTRGHDLAAGVGRRVDGLRHDETLGQGGVGPGGRQAGGPRQGEADRLRGQPGLCRSPPPSGSLVLEPHL